jgi:hypothetical protein
MASVKVKFRPSTIEGKEGTIYYQIIQNRVIRQLKTDYRIFTDEWNEAGSCIIIGTKQSAPFLAGTHGVGPEAAGHDYPTTG